MVYKNKNQHRRGSYFQHLMKILLYVVSVFNMVSSLSQKQQSVKIVQGGLEVFREFYPINEEIIILECVWKSDKFELIERTHKTEIGSHDRALSLGASSVLYQSTESILGSEDTRGFFPSFLSLKQFRSSGPWGPGSFPVSCGRIKSSDGEQHTMMKLFAKRQMQTTVLKKVQSRSRRIRSI